MTTDFRYEWSGHVAEFRYESFGSEAEFRYESFHPVANNPEIVHGDLALRPQSAVVRNSFWLVVGPAKPSFRQEEAGGRIPGKLSGIGRLLIERALDESRKHP